MKQIDPTFLLVLLGPILGFFTFEITPRVYTEKLAFEAGIIPDPIQKRFDLIEVGAKKGRYIVVSMVVEENKEWALVSFFVQDRENQRRPFVVEMQFPIAEKDVIPIVDSIDITERKGNKADIIGYDKKKSELFSTDSNEKAVPKKPSRDVT